MPVTSLVGQLTFREPSRRLRYLTLMLLKYSSKITCWVYNYSQCVYMSVCVCDVTCVHTYLPVWRHTFAHVHVEDQSWCFLQFLLIPWDRVSQWSPEHLCMSSLDCQFVLRIPYYHLPGLKTQVVCLAWEAFIGVLDIGTLVLTLTQLTSELSPLPQVFFKQIPEPGQPLLYWPLPWESPAHFHVLSSPTVLVAMGFRGCLTRGPSWQCVNFCSLRT